MRLDQRNISHVGFPIADVVAASGQSFEFVNGVLGRQVLPEQTGGGEEGVPGAARRRGDGGEVLEARRGGDGDFLAGGRVGLLRELEYPVVVHGHGLAADDVVVHAARAPDILDYMLPAEHPRRHGAEVVGFGFVDVPVGRVREAAKDNGRAGFG